MPDKTKFREVKRWFLENPLYKLANAEEIRKAAKAKGVRLVDAVFRTELDEEEPGKPAEKLRPQYKVEGGSPDSGSLLSTQMHQEENRKLLQQSQHVQDGKEAMEEISDRIEKEEKAIDDAQAKADKAAADAQKERVQNQKEETAVQTAEQQKAAADKAAADKAAAEKAEADKAAAKKQVEADKAASAVPQKSADAK